MSEFKLISELESRIETLEIEKSQFLKRIDRLRNAAEYALSRLESQTQSLQEVLNAEKAEEPLDHRLDRARTLMEFKDPWLFYKNIIDRLRAVWGCRDLSILEKEIDSIIEQSSNVLESNRSPS